MQARADTGRPRLFILYSMLLTVAIADGVALPYLVVYFNLARHIALPLVGLIIGGGAVAALVVGIAGGALLDRFAAVRIYQAAMVLTGLGAIAVAFADSPLSAFGAVVVLYGASGLQWPAQTTLIGENAEGAESNHAFARAFLFLNAGLGIGAFIGSNFIKLHEPETYSLAYRVDGAVAVVVGTIGLQVLARFGRLRSVAKDRASRAEMSRGHHDRGYRAVLRDRVMVVFLLLNALLLLAGYAQIEGGWAAFAALDVGATARIIGLATVANTIVIVALQIPVARMIARMRRSRALAGAALLWLGCWVVCGVAVTERKDSLLASVLLIASAGVFALGETFYSPVAPAISNALAPDHLRGRYNAATNSLWSVTAVLAPPVAAFLIATHNRYLWLGVIAGTCALVAVLVVLMLPRFLPASVESAPLEVDS